MKLRNKKTGDIIESEYMMLVQITSNKGERNLLFEDLAELNNDWEDYKPIEPLIKDEKICKIVREWAECCCIPLLKHYLSNGFSCFICKDEEENEYCLDFTFRINNLESDKIYTIAELCGTEDENE